jgi:ABC-type dipeptide/oligopeptide/nickel transport system ATPase component
VVDHTRTRIAFMSLDQIVGLARRDELLSAVPIPGSRTRAEKSKRLNTADRAFANTGCRFAAWCPHVTDLCRRAILLACI